CLNIRLNACSAAGVKVSEGHHNRSLLHIRLIWQWHF
ncbi:MAG: hypothetical protein ACI8W1_001781, partial [Candidatus Azotimanducaceae bacterium]